MSDAETLRRAAALMRERAEEPVAQPERWPNLVAPPLADWLEAEAARQAPVSPGWDGPRMYGEPNPHALAVARAYLQETP